MTTTKATHCPTTERCVFSSIFHFSLFAFTDDKCIVPENVITFISDEYRETFNVIRTVASIDDKKMEEVGMHFKISLSVLTVRVFIIVEPEMFFD